MRRPEVANNIALAEEAFSLVEQLRPKMIDSGDGSGQYMWCAEKHERFVLLRTKKDGICLRFVTGESRFLCLKDNDNERGGKSLAGSTDQELANTNRELRWFVKLLAACEK